MNCPYEPIQCDLIDKSGMDQAKPCEECPHYPDPVKKLIAAYPLEQMLGFLPKTIIQGRKSIFRMNQVFDLNITRNALENWVISYLNEKNLRPLLFQSNKDIHRCAALMLADLIGLGYIQKLKTEEDYKINKEAQSVEFPRGV
jgi:hypothetical protein